MKIVSILAIAITYLIIDVIWITVVMKPLYIHSLSHLMTVENGQINIQLIPATIVYILLTFGIFYFAVRQNKTLKKCLLDAFILGFIAYGTYDFTCFALFSHWNWLVTMVDVIWGGCICTISALSGWLVLTRQRST